MDTYEITRDELIELANDRINNSRFFNLGVVFELSVKDWKKGDKDRTYIDALRYTGMGRLAEQRKCGYYDNNTGKYVVNRRDFNLVENCPW